MFKYRLILHSILSNNRTVKFGDVHNRIKRYKLESGYIFEEFSYLLLKNHPDILKPNVIMYNRVSPKILTNLNLPTIDKGIDLISGTGIYEGYQCKFKERREREVTYSKITSFVTMLAVSDLTKGTLITNSYVVCNELKNLKKVKVEIIDGYWLDHNCDREIFQIMANWSEV